MINDAFSEEAESVVLGYLLLAETIHDDDFHCILRMLCPEDFYMPGNDEIYNAICWIEGFSDNVTAERVITHIVRESLKFPHRFYNGPKRTEYLSYTLGEMVKLYIDKKCIKAYADIVKARAFYRNVKKLPSLDNVVDIFGKVT